MDQVIARLVSEGEFVILGSNDRVRSKSLRNLDPTDRIALPTVPLLPGLFRRQ